MSRIDDLARPARLPLRLALACVLAALLIAAALLAWLAWQFTQIPPPLALALRVLFFAVPIGGAVELGAIAWRRWGTHEYIKATHVTRLTTAQAQKFPAGLHSLSFHDSSRPALPAPAEPLSLPAPDAGPAAVPTFAQLLDAGRVGPGQPLILGFRADDGQAITGSWLDLYSVGVGALPGAGKSWLAAFLLAQSAAAGARLIVGDLHAGDPESLATRIAALSPAYMCDVASTPDAILTALKLANDKLLRRRTDLAARWPIIIAVDEWTSLIGANGETFSDIAAYIAQEGRKFGVNCLLSAQGWTKDTSGKVRNRLSSHYLLRQRPDEARYQFGLYAGQMPLDVRFLPDATGYLLDTHGRMTKIVVPQMTTADLERVGARIAGDMHIRGAKFGFAPAPTQLTPSAQIVAEPKPERSQNVAAPAAATAALGTATSASPEAARAAALFVAGSSPAEIVREMRGVSSREGSRYQAALTEILDLIRQGYRGGQDGS